MGFAATILLTGCGGDITTKTDVNAVDPTVPVSDWQLVWSDEFDGTSIDTKKWNFEVNCDGGGNQEKQCYTDSPENAFVADGNLNIVAKKAAADSPLPYTSARLNTKNIGDWKYGRFEMRAKLPSGQGAWPAFWMLPTDSVYGEWPKSGEIDIMEAVNLKTVNADGVAENNVYGTLHYGSYNPEPSLSGKNYQLPDGANPADDFHTYALEWQEGEIRWYVDGYLYETQMASEVRYNSKGEAVGLKHRGWFSEFYNIITGDLETHWDNSPFDQKFHILLNLAVGGSWPSSVNNTGIDDTAFENGQSLVVDYVRVYECSLDRNTGKGCETVRAGYKSEGTLVEGAAPIPAPPSTGIPVNLTIFKDDQNPAWPIWDCCGGSTPTVETDDADHGAVAQFIIGAAPTVMGFNVHQAENPLGFDASPMAATGKVEFDMKVVTAPANADSVWKFKIESNSAGQAVELDLAASNEGLAPVVGQWQHYSFDLKTLADAGLDLSNIDVLMIFPAWGTGEGAVYRVDNVVIGQAGATLPELVLFEDAANSDWAIWDCCGGSTPIEVMDDAAHGNTAEFTIGAAPTVMGFKPADGSGIQFDASALLTNGVVQFDMKVVTAPNDSSSVWKFKIESGAATTAVELDLTASQEGLAPVTGQWQTYTFKLKDLSDAGLDVSAIDVVMVFPAWGTGEGAVYRLDNAKIYDPTSTAPAAPSNLILYKDTVATDWSIWDCCGGSTPVAVDDDAAHGSTAEFSIGAAPTVMGFLAADNVYFDASGLTNGVVKFDMKVMSAPNDSSAVWKFKIESGDATAAVELNLTDSLEGAAPVTGQWQTYTYSLQDLFDAGLDISQIDVVMVFPAWGTGEGAVYRIDNASISAQ